MKTKTDVTDQEDGHDKWISSTNSAYFLFPLLRTRSHTPVAMDATEAAMPAAEGAAAVAAIDVKVENMPHVKAL